MFSILFMGLIGYGVYRLVKHANEQNPSNALTEARLRAQQARQYRPSLRERWASNDYVRMAGSPRIHKKALKDAGPMTLLFAVVLAMSVIVAQDALATSMVAIACFLIFVPMFWYLNMEARKEYNKNHDADLIVSQELAESNDFTIPNDWTKKYL